MDGLVMVPFYCYFKAKLFSTVLVPERKLFTKVVQLSTMGFKMVPSVILNGLILVL